MRLREPFSTTIIPENPNQLHIILVQRAETRQLFSTKNQWCVCVCVCYSSQTEIIFCDWHFVWASINFFRVSRSESEYVLNFTTCIRRGNNDTTHTHTQIYNVDTFQVQTIQLNGTWSIDINYKYNNKKWLFTLKSDSQISIIYLVVDKRLCR